MHNQTSKMWEKRVWQFPLIHRFKLEFGLSAEAATKAHTIAQYLFQDNALVDYELIKVNPENADFATVAHGNVMAGSYIPKINVNWKAHLKSDDTEITMLKFDTMRIHTSMLSSLDAFDKKTGATTQSLLELQGESTDEQCGPLYTGTKLFESQGTDNPYPDHPFHTTDGQQEGVAWDKDTYFKARHYYTNKEMLAKMTDPLMSHTVVEPIVPHGRAIVYGGQNHLAPMNKFQQPYSFAGELFSVPQVGDSTQYHLPSDTSAIEHLSIQINVSFNEFNPDFNYARA